MSTRISDKAPSSGFVYVEVIGNGKHEAISVGDTIVGGVWTGMGSTRKQFAVRIERLEEAIAAYKASMYVAPDRRADQRIADELRETCYRSTLKESA